MIFKFGGTSVADAARIRHVAALVAAQPRPPVVVVSALAGTTDALVRLAATLRAGGDAGAELAGIRERHLAVAAELDGDADLAARLRVELGRTLDALENPILRTLADDEMEDRVRAAGEDLCVQLVAAAVAGAGGRARVVDARTLVTTDATFGQATPDEAALERNARERLAPLLAEGVTPVVQGFVGATPDGRTTTLGRGGSDLTATLLGAALEAVEVHIWTDVDGVLAADPRTVTAPGILDVLGFEEAVELAYFGAKVLHPGAAKHAVSRGLAVRIRNTFAPERPGTRVLRDRRGPAEIAAIAYKPGVALIQVRSHPQAMPYGFLARVFGVLARHQLPVDLVATSHTSTAFTLDAASEISDVARELGAFADVEVHLGLATVTVVGHGLLAEPGISAAVFDAVQPTPVRLISQASDVSLSFVVAETTAPDLVRRLHTRVIQTRDQRASGPPPSGPPRASPASAERTPPVPPAPPEALP